MKPIPFKFLLNASKISKFFIVKTFFWDVVEKSTPSGINPKKVHSLKKENIHLDLKEDREILQLNSSSSLR